MLPNTPEPIESLRARYPAALEHVYDQESVAYSGAVRPGECRANVFDFEDGLRLIISRKRDPWGDVWLHYSASFPSDCRIADEVRLLRLTSPLARVMAMWVESVPSRFADLSGDQRPVDRHWRSEIGIPHWLIREDRR